MPVAHVGFLNDEDLTARAGHLEDLAVHRTCQGMGYEIISLLLERFEFVFTDQKVIFATAQAVLLEFNIIEDIILLGLLILLLANGTIPISSGWFRNVKAFEVVDLIAAITDQLLMVALRILITDSTRRIL